jgi:hypothetical protein
MWLVKLLMLLLLKKWNLNLLTHKLTLPSESLCDLTKSGSDKAMHLQKQYSHLMDPIIEENPKENEMSEDKVDYDSSSSHSEILGQGMDRGGHPRMAIMALAGPRLED